MPPHWPGESGKLGEVRAAESEQEDAALSGWAHSSSACAVCPQAVSLPLRVGHRAPSDLTGHAMELPGKGEGTAAGTRR